MEKSDALRRNEEQDQGIIKIYLLQKSYSRS